MITLRDFDSLSLRDLQCEDLALEYLSILLKHGELALLLGSGVSKGLGLPNWDELVAGCETAVGIVPSEGRSSQALMKAIDTVRREFSKHHAANDLQSLVRTNLYPQAYLDAGEYPQGIMSNRMLIAIGAIVMASSRGSVGDVFTLNFDDVLEWYLHLHGYKTQVVSDFPTYLRGDVDVTVFHPHGFLPLVEKTYPKSEWLVLSYSDLISRLSASADTPWPTLLGSRFLSKRFLAIGTSMNDVDIDVHLARAKRDVGGRGLLGFVLTSGLRQDRAEELMEIGLVPISVDSFERIPSFILNVCRKAAAL
ncbi:SIR2-like domain-containing protein [Rhodococcoides kroppenstedtii]|uniref:SIR2-like domain-containing protein n=1 Tax=Rhodococcoides kroppenstedtii TaxID=293050 RepID=A0A1I0TJ95_9NOCA|nr:SIR2 family protein [Rhodococcus kroppenstedtii]MBT1190981.1 SIR2 family protein [Rhodococcus kroppenstedtii]SFA51868.1 SIR2-like domain-containing protein [Rhodococcus kroppenstedtii]